VSISITVTDVDLGFDATWRRLDALNNATVEAGLPESAGENASIGAWQELGTRTIPARPWLSVAADVYGSQILSTAGDAVASVADGFPASKALAQLGRFTADRAREVITSQQVGGPPLAASTVEAKGSSAKLIDTGALVRAIDYEVSQ
jgi:hypothetical protein